MTLLNQIIHIHRRSVIVLNDPEPQYHNFYSQNDKDWVKFYGIAHERYKIEVYNLQANCDIEVPDHYKTITSACVYVLFNSEVSSVLW
jgi:hypothetical protein